MLQKDKNKRKDTMSKATYKIKHFIWGLQTVSLGESVTIMAGNKAADRQAWHWSRC